VSALITAQSTNENPSDGISARSVLTFVGFLGFTYCYMLRVNINIAVVAMVNYTAIPHTNITTAEECGREDQNSSIIDPNMVETHT